MIRYYQLFTSYLYPENKLYQSVSTAPTGLDSQGEGLIPAGVEGGTDGPGLLFGLILWVGGELELNVRVWKSIWIHGDQVPGFTHYKQDRGQKKTENVTMFGTLSQSTLI